MIVTELNVCESDVIANTRPHPIYSYLPSWTLYSKGSTAAKLEKATSDPQNKGRERETNTEVDVTQTLGEQVITNCGRIEASRSPGTELVTETDSSIRAVGDPLTQGDRLSMLQHSLSEARASF